jgi:hypothetical protein
MQIIGGYSAGINAALTCQLGRAGAIADQAAGRGKRSILVGRWYRSAGRERYEAIFAIVNIGSAKRAVADLQGVARVWLLGARKRIGPEGASLRTALRTMDSVDGIVSNPEMSFPSHAATAPSHEAVLSRCRDGVTSSQGATDGVRRLHDDRTDCWIRCA